MSRLLLRVRPSSDEERVRLLVCTELPVLWVRAGRLLITGFERVLGCVERMRVLLYPFEEVLKRLLSPSQKLDELLLRLRTRMFRSVRVSFLSLSKLRTERLYWRVASISPVLEIRSGCLRSRSCSPRRSIFLLRTARASLSRSSSILER